MKLTNQQLKQIIREEMAHVIIEVTGFTPTPEMEAMKYFHSLIDALKESGQLNWVDILERLRPELESDLDTEAKAERDYSQDVVTNAPRDYAGLEEDLANEV